jgi:CheY-like chemotaxis protein
MNAIERKRSDLSVWRIDYLALLEEKTESGVEEKSARWSQWYEEYIQFMNEMVPEDEHKQFHRLLMDVINDRHWCIDHNIDYEDPSVQLSALALCQVRYGQSSKTKQMLSEQLAMTIVSPDDVVTGKIIMVVDDDDDVREVLTTILEHLGYSVIACESGEEALIETEKSCPDMVFLDYNMPKQNGMDVLRELMAIAPKLKVVMLTGYANLAAAKEAVDIGVVDYVSKPLDVKLVSEIVEDVLS